MAAYAAAVSLKHILDLIKNHPSPPISFDKQQLHSLTQLVHFLQEFLEAYVSPYSYSDEADPFEMRIAEAVYAAEDVIESYIVDNIHLAAPPSTTEDDSDDDDNDDDDDDDQNCMTIGFAGRLRKSSYPGIKDRIVSFGAPWLWPRSCGKAVSGKQLRTAAKYLLYLGESWEAENAFTSEPWKSKVKG